MSKKILRAIAALIASVGIFAFAGCGTDDKTNSGDSGESNQTGSTENGSGNENTGGNGGGSGNENTGGNGGGGGTQTPGTNPGGGSGNENTGGGGNQGGSENPAPPVIPTVPEGSVHITKAAGDLEAAYVTWDKVSGAMGYNVYCKEDGGEYKKLDAPLVREYKNYFRADAVGLKAGTYAFKVVPTGGASLTEDESKAATAESITVLAHERSGYAFSDSNVPGAYNLDGTLKSGAQVVYVTAANAKTVKATVNGTDVTGFQSILDVRKKSSEPLCFRIVGTVNKDDLDHISSSSEGLQIKGAGTAEENKATSNITIEGIGSDGTVNGFGFLIRNCKNVEMRNLGIVNFMDDGVSIDTGNSHLWMHNLDIFYGNAGGDKDQAKGDGSLDIKLSKYCTVSYNHFWDSGKCCLLDASEASSGGSDYITYHHNWFDHSDSRHARVRNSAHTHIYNNYFDGNSKYGIGAAAGSTVFAENNYFRSTATMTPMIIGSQAHDIKSDGGSTLSKEVGGMIKAFGNEYDCPQSKLALIERTKDSPASLTDFDCYTAATREEQIPSSVTTKGGKTYNNFDTASDFYKYTVDTAEQAKANVEKYAGRIDGGDLKWEFDDAAEDGNYSIIPELKAAVTGYKSEVVKIGNVEVSGGSSGGSTGGDSGETGGNTGGDTTGGGTLSGDVTRIDLIKSNDGKYPEGVTVTGSYKSDSNFLKMEKATTVTIKVGKDTTFTIHATVASKKIKINGTAVMLDANGEYTGNIKAGETLTITKGDSMELEYILLS